MARQTLDLAQESLRNTRSRVEIGTLAPIDVVQAESEVASREEAVILAEASIGQSEDQLRSLIFDPKTPGFFDMRLEPTDVPELLVQEVDVTAAVEPGAEGADGPDHDAQAARGHRLQRQVSSRTRRCRAWTRGSTTTRPAWAAHS